MRKSMALMVQHAGQRTQRNQKPAAMAAPIVGENSIGIRLTCRSFQTATSRSASAMICGSVARCSAAVFSAALVFHLAAIEAHDEPVMSP
ncbi:MAG: hypothetical protein WAV38_01860 [Xanthobacteraceae bacterium]